MSTIMSSWELLAAALRARRTDLGLTQAEVAEAGEVSVDTIRNLEHGRRTPRRINPRTARAIDRALRWELGSVEETLAGGGPRPLRDAGRADLPAAAARSTPFDPAGAREARETHRFPSPAAAAGAAPGDPGDRLALARQLVGLRATLAAHQASISPEARDDLAAEMSRSAREAEEAIVRMLPWLDERERGEAIELLVALREPAPWAQSGEGTGE